MGMSGMLYSRDVLTTLFQVPHPILQQKFYIWIVTIFTGAHNPYLCRLIDMHGEVILLSQISIVFSIRDLKTSQEGVNQLAGIHILGV